MVLPKIGLASSALREKFTIARPPVSVVSRVLQIFLWAIFRSHCGFIIYLLRFENFSDVRASNRGNRASRFSIAPWYIQHPKIQHRFLWWWVQVRVDSFGNHTKSCLSWSRTVIGNFLYRWVSIHREYSLCRPDIAMSSKAPRVLSSVSSAIMSSTMKSIFLPEKNAESNLSHSSSLPPGSTRKTRSSSLIQLLAR